MSAPRLSVGLIGTPTISERLAQAGHMVSFIAAEEVPAYNLIVIEAHGTELEETINEVAQYSRRGQMVMHTSFAHGVQVLDPIETTGALVMAAHALTDTVWATAAADELGETVVGLLVAEMGGIAMMITESQRTAVEAALTYKNLADIMHNDAIDLLNETLDNSEAAEQLIEPITSAEYRLPTIDELARQHAQITNAGRAHMFAALVHRYADMFPHPDLELWAISQLNYKE